MGRVREVGPALACEDPQVEAVLAVLGGAGLADVAERYGTDAEAVQRWVEQFVEGGRLRLGGQMDSTSVEARDRFLVLIAHEFRTPLTIIGGWVETMLGTELPPTQRAQVLEVVHKQVAHLERIARDALDAGALSQGHLRLLIGPVNLRHLVRSVVSSLRDERVDLAAGLEIEVIGDGSRLEQVSGGVLEQARRIAGGDPLAIVLDDDHPDHVTVRVVVEGRRLSFAEASALFEPYGRADTSVGTGLGLYLCRALLAAHGGELGIDSRGATTTLWFQLPRQGPEIGPLVERA
jgi:signal transduction histidine kinase